MANPIPTPATGGNPAPATEFYEGKALKVVATLAVLSLAIAMIVGSCSSKGKAGAVGVNPDGSPKIISYSMEPPIYFGPSKRVELDLKPDEWSPVIITPERCKSVVGVVSPPVGFFIQFPDGREVEVTPTGKEGWLPPKSGRGEYRFRGAQPGQKLVMHVTY